MPSHSRQIHRHTAPCFSPRKQHERHTNEHISSGFHKMFIPRLQHTVFQISCFARIYLKEKNRTNSEQAHRDKPFSLRESNKISSHPRGTQTAHVRPTSPATGEYPTGIRPHHPAKRPAGTETRIEMILIFVLIFRLIFKIILFSGYHINKKFQATCWLQLFLSCNIPPHDHKYRSPSVLYFPNSAYTTPTSGPATGTPIGHAPDIPAGQT